MAHRLIAGVPRPRPYVWVAGADVTSSKAVQDGGRIDAQAQVLAAGTDAEEIAGDSAAHAERAPLGGGAAIQLGSWASTVASSPVTTTQERAVTNPSVWLTRIM